jgi:radical SAM superfamily enzyme YgiQ (UPF0313 family)
LTETAIDGLLKMNRFKRHPILSRFEGDIAVSRSAITRENLLSEERGTIVKKRSCLRVALGFPNTYDLGISNLGFQTIYRLLNRMDQVACERFFLRESDFGRSTRTLESDRNIRDFDIIAFSVPFELDYSHILKLLKSSRIPLLFSARNSRTPLVIAGGIAPTLNPGVLAPFMDCILIGEAEEMLPELIEKYLQLHAMRMGKERFLLELSKTEGIYVPRFYHPTYHDDGTVKDLKIEGGAPSTIKRRSVDLKDVETFSPLISPHSHFKNTFLVEVGRGCARGCRFCAAGYIYRPCRFHAKEAVLSQVTRHSAGSQHVGLIGSLISDHPQLEEICSALASMGLEIGTSSLRADMVSPGLLKILVHSGLQTLTVAPEVGTSRMWKIIKKDMEAGTVLRSAILASQAGVPNLKLYFMLGLPFEEDRDVLGIVELVRQVHEVFVKERPSARIDKKGLRKLRVSVNPFVPKPHTPFQWCAMERQQHLRRKLNLVQKGIRNLKGVRMEKKSVRQAVLQAVLSLGNRKVGMGLYYSMEENLGLSQAWKKAGVQPDLIAFTPKNTEAVLPWDMIDTGVSRELLTREFEQAKKAANERA